MIVLDVNAAIAIAKGTEEGRALRELMIEGEEVIAPHFFLTELGNVVWQIVRAGELDEEDFPLLFERAAGFVDRFVPAEDKRSMRPFRTTTLSTTCFISSLRGAMLLRSSPSTKS